MKITLCVIHKLFVTGLNTSCDLSDVAPSLLTVFPDHTGHSAESVSFKCISSGNPLPQVTWYLDDVVVTQSSRISAGDYVSELGHVVSFLNISETRVEDSGEYKCHVSNDVGSVSHEGRLNIYGQPFVRQMSNVTAIAGEDLVIRCPYGGYPVKGVRWLKGKYFFLCLLTGILHSLCNIVFIMIPI